MSKLAYPQQTEKQMSIVLSICIALVVHIGKMQHITEEVQRNEIQIK